MATRKELILLTVKDLVSDLFDRREDEELPPGSIEAAYRAGEITEEDLVCAFETAFFDGLEAHR